MAITDKKGISVTSGFKLVAPSPIDARFIVEDETELQSIIDSGAAYNGLEVWVNSISKKKQYNGTEFVDVQAGISEEQVEEIVDEKVGDIDAVLDEINGGGTLSGGASSGGTSSGQEVEIEFSIATSDTDGVYNLTQITAFTDWHKVKNGKLILIGSSEMATPSDIEVELSSVMKSVPQNIEEEESLMIAMSSVLFSEGDTSGIGFQRINGETIISASGLFNMYVGMYISMGTTTCTLIVTI